MSSLMFLSDEEEKVYDAIQHYIDYNRVFNCEKLIPFISNAFSRSSININEKGIRNILENLEKKKIVIQGSKLTNAIVLQNPNRRIIYKFIKNNPGFYLHRLVKTLELPNHVISWHLDMLLKFGYIKKVIIENHEVYFHPSVVRTNYQVLYALSKVKTQKILSIMYKNSKPLTKTSMAKELGFHYNTITKYIELLKELNIITEEKLAHKTIYQLSRKFLNFFT